MRTLKQTYTRKP